MSKQVEPLQIVDGILSAVHIVEDNERLALALETLLCDDVDDITEFGKDLAEGFDQDGDFDALVKAAYLERIIRDT